MSGKNISSSLISNDKNDTVYLRIAEDIRTSIRQGKLNFGEKLDAEGKLCTFYHSNVYSVRMAINLLKKEGLVYSIPKFGTYIGESSAAKASTADDMTLALQKTLKITLGTAAKFQSQRDFWKRFEEYVGGRSLFYELDVQFNMICKDKLPNDLYEFGSFYPDYYLNRDLLLNVSVYFSGMSLNVNKEDPFGIPTSYSTPVLFFNKKLLKKLNFKTPSYTGYASQMEYVEAVTAAAVADPLLKAPGSMQSAILRLGNHLKIMFNAIRSEGAKKRDFIASFHEIFVCATTYWKKYLISYPKQAENNFQDFLVGRSPFFFGMNSTYSQLASGSPDLDWGCAMQYSCDDTFSRIPVMLSVRADTLHPVECLQVAAESQADEMQKLLAQNGSLPIDEKHYDDLPYQLKIAPATAANPLLFNTREEFYVSLNIINVEMWNVILLNKPIDQALADIFMLSRAYLNMQLDRMSLEKQKQWYELYNM